MSLKPILCLAALAVCLAGCSASVFTDDERRDIQTEWNAPGRYSAGLPADADIVGPWQVRLTSGGSVWFHAYQAALHGAEKIAPTQDAGPQTEQAKRWEAWVVARLAYDRWAAQSVADSANAAVTKRRPIAPAAAPPVPGPIPADLLAAAGNPPALASAVTPFVYTVTFPDSDTYTYRNNVSMRPRYAYYRFPQGTNANGPNVKDLPATELDHLFSAAGMTPSEQHVAKAVSILEGGFESVNTYDTGYVSIGFIQFITAVDGTGSLCEVMAREKVDHPTDYAADFHHWGIDLDSDGVLTVVDPDTGAELTGAPAVMRVIEDKRLTAIFQRAGRRSEPFRIAQVMVAKSHYWPLDDPFTVTVNGTTLTGKVSDIVSSEAGTATLFDRKVNRGSVSPFSDVVQKTMVAHNLTTLADAAKYERNIIAALKYRTDFLADPSLTQPPMPPTSLTIAASTLLTDR